jgi:hypothetical protein
MAKAKSTGGGNSKKDAETVREDKRPIVQNSTKNIPVKSDSVQAAQKQSSAAKKSQAANEKAFKNSLPSLTSNFKGAGVASYLDKDGNVPSVGTPINNSPGPSGTGNGGNNEYIDTNPQMDPTPEPVLEVISEESSPVRIAQRNVFDISSLVPELSPEHIAKILFENVSAIELSISERHDTIEGINQKYSIISNLSEIRKKYDAEKQLSTMDKLKPLTSIYAINIEDKIPKEDYIKLEGLESTYKYLDENNQIVDRQKGYYYIDTNGDLVIELINLERSQEVEVYIDTNGTIYKIDKVES